MGFDYTRFNPIQRTILVITIVVVLTILFSPPSLPDTKEQWNIQGVTNKPVDSQRTGIYLAVTIATGLILIHLLRTRHKRHGK